MNPLVKEQAPPAPNGRPATWDLVIARAEAALGRVEGEREPSRVALVEDMKARHAEGMAKYGTPLQPGNGRDSLVDLYQEILDACAYSENAWVEAGPDEDHRPVNLRILADELRFVALRVRRLIDARDATGGAPCS